MGNFICKYCGKEVGNSGCLSLHERHCKENPNRIICNGNYGKTKGYRIWNKGLKACNDERVKKYRNSRHQSYLDGKIKLFEHHSEESKKLLREKSIEYIEKTKGKCHPRYNINGCKYINKLNKENNWHLQHAENGGEYLIDGYYLDGYDKELNIVFEYDEPRHYKDLLNNILNDKDIERQNYIINKLNCEFYRYNEYLDYFYKVN